MKSILCLLALVAVSRGGVVGRASFDDNFSDFLDVISDEAGEQLASIFSEYENDEEFAQAMIYLATQNFVDIIREMEGLDEFVAVTDFLEADNIHVHNYIDLLNQALGITRRTYKSVPVRRTGTGFNGMLRDVIDGLPKDSLSALFDQKMENDEEFRTTMSNLQSEEFATLWNALWESAVFRGEAEALAANGISVELMVEEVMAIFGQ